MLNRSRLFRYQSLETMERINRDTSKKDQFNIQIIENRDCNTLFDEFKKQYKSS